jgi:hypothetical protein
MERVKRRERKMKKSILGAFLAGTVLLLFSVTGVQAAFVTFSNIADGDGISDNFDAVATAAGAGGSNTLDIVLNNFTADGALGAVSALDTLSFTVTAPAGYWITKVSYDEGGIGETTQGIAIATGSITAGGTPKNFPTQIFGTNSVGDWTTGGWVNIANSNEIEVSIVNSLFATTFGGPNDIANISKTEASVTVDLAQIPIPSAILLLFSGLVAVISIRKRSQGAE